MFARATNRSFTCLRCQHRLLVREVCWTESQNISAPSPRRWRYSAANAAVDAEYGEEIPEDEQQVPIIYDTSSPFRNRRWRPTPTAEIGVDVLGKPAEILVLPPNRKKRRTNTGLVEETSVEDVEVQDVQQNAASETHPGIYESLTAESKPTLMKEALENIQRIREEAKSVAVDGFLGSEQWRKYFKALSEGFTKKQILQYLEENSNKPDSPSADSKSTLPSQALTRVRGATEIMTTIWGLTNDIPKVPKPRVSRCFDLGRGRRELILGIDKEWRRFNQHVTVEPISSRGVIQITGSETWVKKAHNVFSSLKKRVREQTIVLPRRYTHALNAYDSAEYVVVRSLLLDLIEKHEIVMVRRNEWTAYAFNADDIVNFERDLLLSQKRISWQMVQMWTPPLLSLDPVDKTSQMPVYRHILASDGITVNRYSRVNSLDHHRKLPTSIDIAGGEVKELIDRLEMRAYDQGPDVLDSRFPPTPEVTVGSLVHQDFAVVGQLLHYDDSSHHHLVEDEGRAIAPRTTFLSTIPFLSHFVSAQKEFPQGDVIDKNTTLLLLTLTPLNQWDHPEIEIEATTSASMDVRSDLSIKSVKLTASAISTQVVIPTTPFDLEFVRRRVVSIFDRGNAVQESYAPFLSQLGAQLRHDEDKSKKNIKNIHFKKLLDLDLSCLRSEPLTKSHPGKPNRKFIPTRYALDRVERIEKHVYRLHEQDKVLLEHTAYIPTDDSSTQVPREALTIVPVDAESPVESGVRLQNYAKSAFQVVNVLTSFVAEKTAAMNSKNEVPDQEQSQEQSVLSQD